MKYAVLCPGQGAQHRAMLDRLRDHGAARAVLAETSAVMGVDAAHWLDDDEAMFRNDVAQPLICMAQLATWHALRDSLPRPAYAAGYSVGELASYACAGALDAGELVRLVSARANLMQQALHGVNGGLIAIRGLARDEIDRLCAGRDLWPAIVLGDMSVILGGIASAIDAVALDATAKGGDVRCLKVGVPAHTPLLSAAVPLFERVLADSALRAPDPQVIAGIDGDLVDARARAISTLAQQLARTIQWSRGMDTLHERGCRLFLELGPGSALSSMMRERFGDVEARSIDDFRSLDGAIRWMQARLD
jgi:[acyl-carrier-protein] S-malonyltransferase